MTSDALPATALTTAAERRVALVAVLLLVAGLAVAAVRMDGAPALVRLDRGALPSDVPTPPAVPAEVLARAQASAGCELLVDGQPLEDRRHLDPDRAPPAAALYPDDRPAHSGRHFSAVAEVLTGVATDPLDERAVLHNMEHGSVVVWFDPDQVDPSEVAELDTWLRERLALGFVSRAAGAVFASPSDAIASGRAIALRAWGVALDCDRFDITVADGFLQAHWGSHGGSPEAHLSPFPVGVLGEVGDAV